MLLKSQLAALKLEMAEGRTKLDTAQQRYLSAEQENAHFRGLKRCFFPQNENGLLMEAYLRNYQPKLF
jgi:hypothetical protein